MSAARLRGGPLLVKLVRVEVFGRVVRVRVHTWRLRGGRRAVVLAAAVARAGAAVRRALPVRTVSASPPEPPPRRASAATRPPSWRIRNEASILRPITFYCYS